MKPRTWRCLRYRTISCMPPQPPALPEVVQPNGPGDDFRGLPHLILTSALPSS